ncbi:MAG: glycosyltransferase family 39 protein [Patescibacteria group bacterium]
MIKNYINWILLVVIVLASFGLMLNASLQESATMDESAHIPAGYGYVKYLDYRLNPEHPPLVKALAALPLIFQNLNFPTDKSSWQTDINGQWVAGAQFLYESDNNADKIIQWSRLAPMLLTLILIIFIYLWGKELLGRWWALLPAFLFSLSPTVLTHGHYVTTDVGATLGIFCALYFFVKFLSTPSKKYLVFAGISFGIAQLLKFSSVLIIPFFIFLIIVFYIREVAVSKKFFIQAFQYIKNIFIIFLIGYAVVYAVYFIFTINYPIEKQKSDTEITLTSFADRPTLAGENCKPMRCLADANIWMSGNKFLRPFAEYMLGVLMVIQRSSGGNTGYFLGEVSASGWWYYFPILFILKEPIPSLILILIAFLFGIWNIIKKSIIQSVGWRTKFKILADYLALHFAEFSMLSFAVFYWLYSIKSPLNIGIRHILPTMPFIYILTVSAAKKIVNSSIIRKCLLAALFLWFALETLFATPYYLSYFNQFGNGIQNGYKNAVDSNYDWGQDLKRFKKFVDNPPVGEKIEKIAIDYFGGGNPKYYLGDKVEYWQSSRDNPIYENIKWLAVSINTLQNATGKLHPGQQRNPEDEYQWLQKIKNPHKPDYRVGTSIFIYKLD